MDRQAHTGTTDGDDRKDPYTAVVARRRRGKDDRKQNTMAPLPAHAEDSRGPSGVLQEVGLAGMFQKRLKFKKKML